MKYKIMKYSLFTIVALLVGCGSPVRTLRKLQPTAKVDYTEDELNARRQVIKGDTASVDTVKRAINYTKSDGTKVMLIESTYDSVSNSSMAMMYIPQVTVSARSLRRVAERNGKIQIGFQLIVPAELQRTSWRTRLQPMLRRDDGETDSLKTVLLTGESFRLKQHRDYQRYKKYLMQIIPDSADFFQSYVHRRAYSNYTRGLIRQRTYLDRTLRKPYDLNDNPLIGRFELFNRLNLRKNESYEAKIVRQRERVLGRKVDAYAKAFVAVATAEEPSRLARRQVDFSSIKFERFETRSLYRLGGWSPFRHYPFVRDTQDAAHRDTLRQIATQESLQRRLGRLPQVDSAEIVKRFINHKKIALNQKRFDEKDLMFDKIVPFPFEEGLQLDSVVNARDTLRYFYSKEVEADENTSKLYVYLKGEVADRTGMFYQFTAPDTLNFSVSSMTSFVDETPRYVQRILTRDAEANARFQIEFPKNKSRLNERFGNNAKELQKVKETIGKLMTDPIYIIDSIKVTAASSPEGNLSVNKRIADERSASFSEFMKEELKHWRDSLNVQSSVVLHDDGTTSVQQEKEHLPDLDHKIRVESIAEDWDRLTQLITDNDSLFKRGEEMVKMIAEISNPDRREIAIRRAYPADYAIMREELYPKLRAVEVKFNLLRRGMRQDTIYTTELDSAYAEGVRLLKARKYAAAIEYLREYDDVNTALAYMSLGYDDAALRVFLQQKPTDNILYSTAILYARKGDDTNAVQQLMRAVEMNPRLRFRGNLDPEIAALIKRYRLFEDDY